MSETLKTNAENGQEDEPFLDVFGENMLRALEAQEAEEKDYAKAALQALIESIKGQEKTAAESPKDGVPPEKEGAPTLSRKEARRREVRSRETRLKAPEGLLAIAKKQFDAALARHPEWKGYAEQGVARYNLGPNGVATLFAFARFESGFRPDAKAGASTAAGLGQFLKRTWGAFQNSLPSGDPLRGRSPHDPEAAFVAMAWFARENANALGLDTSDPDFAKKLYLAHHEGAGGAIKLLGYLAGGPAGTVPKSYLGKRFPKFGVPKVETYADYAKLVTNMADRVQSVADLYSSDLIA